MPSKANAGLIAGAQRGRKLTAIIHADMVGYSRLIELDDAGTLRRLRALRRALILPAIREHGGTIVKTAGDSMLMVFDSIDGAVRFAVKVQKELPLYDSHQPSGQAIRFRVGINIGDVISDGLDYHGDGVNIAARLQAECPVGGICVSRTVRDHVHGRLHLDFKELGPLVLKNIARPVEAYLVRFDSGESSHLHAAAGDKPSPVRQVAEPPRRSAARMVNSPFGFVVMAVLIVEAILGMLAGQTGTPEITRLMAAIVVLLIGTSALLAWLKPEIFSAKASAVASPSNAGLLKVFQKSNDFLATGDATQFPSLLEGTKSEAWFVGTTFYITTNQYTELILAKLAEGVDLNFLILNPEGEALKMMAELLADAKGELALYCMSGIRVLDRILETARAANSRGALRVKLLNEPIQTRLYIFDPKSKDGYLYFIPLLNGSNSQTVPGFLVSNAAANYHPAYFQGVQKMWNHPAAQSFEAWKSAHADFKQSGPASQE